MQKSNRKVCLIIFLVLFFSNFSHADILITRNGDRLFGEIITPLFALQAPYGQIVIRTDFLKKISFIKYEINRGRFQSINNDTFNGVILNYDVRIRLDRGGRETIRYDDIETILIESEGQRHNIRTSVVSLKNDDKFSGLIHEPEIKMQVAFNIKTIPVNKINRIEFGNDSQTDSQVLLTNGDLLVGKLLLDQLPISPESISELSIETAMIKSIQFNSEKLVLNEYAKLPPPEQDGDGDAVPNNEDKCPQTPWGQPVNADGCEDSAYALVREEKLDEKPRSLDADKDNVLDVMDRCLDTPAGVGVDSTGCWTVSGILFEFGQFSFRPQSRPILNEVLAVLKKNPGLKIEIRGYTDNLGSAAYNQWLSERRSQTVKEYFVSRGIDENRLSAKGYGSSNNKAANDTKQGRALNRRAAIVQRRD